MPRNISGTYTLAPGNPVVTGTIIEAAWANPTMSDIANALTDSLSRSGSGGMLVPFRNADGAVGTPGMSWVNEPSSGWYRIALNDFWYSVGNENIFRINKDGIELAAGKAAININVSNRVQDTDPAPVPNGSGWFESDTGNFYMRYQNPDLTYTYIQLNTAVQGIPLALLGAPNGAASLDNLGQVPPSQLGNAILITEKGAPLGVATLDATGKVPASQIPVSGGIPTFTDLFVTGKTVLGSSVAIGSAGFEFHATLGNPSVFSLNRWQNNNAGVPVVGNKSRSGVIGVHTILQNADGILTVTGAGSDGVGFIGAGTIQLQVDGVPAVGIMPGRWVFTTVPPTGGAQIEAMRITSNQVVVVGGAGALAGAVGIIPRFQVHGTDAGTARISSMRWSADGNAASMSMGKSRGAAIGTHTAVVDGDNLATFNMFGSDGVNFIAAAQITAFVDGVPGVNSMPGRIEFRTTPSGSASPLEAMRIDPVQRVVIGGVPAQTLGGATIPRFQVLGTDAATARVGFARYGADIAAFNIFGCKSRGAAIGTQTIVQDGDGLLAIVALGSDGVQFIQAASINFGVDGVPGLNDMPGRITFSTTPDGAVGPVEAMRIDNAGRTIFSPGVPTPTPAVGGSGLQFHCTLGTPTVFLLGRWQSGAATGGMNIVGLKSKSGIVGSHAGGIIADGDIMLNISGQGSDGVAGISAGSMQVSVDGTPAVGVMPGAWIFNTQPSAGGVTVPRVKIGRNGSVILNHSGAALLTTATEGYTYIPTCAGVPTGVPLAVTGAAAMVINTTNNKLMFYSTGAWRDAGP